jgi:hypothetical protein
MAIRLRLDEGLLPVVMKLSRGLDVTYIDPDLSFMADSLKELLKAFQSSQYMNQDGMQNAINQYAYHIASYIYKRSGIGSTREQSHTSIITATGPDLYNHISQHIRSKKGSCCI